MEDGVVLGRERVKMEGGEGMIEIDGRSVTRIFGDGKVVGKGVFRLEGNADRSRNALKNENNLIKSRLVSDSWKWKGRRWRTVGPKRRSRK